MTTEIATAEPKQPLTLRAHIARMQPEFAKALPGHISPERFVRTAQTAIALTRNIDKVKNHNSLLAACTKAAADGLILDGREAALVVDYNGDVQYRPMMRGLLKLAYNSGQLRSIVVEIVRKGDHFRHIPTRVADPIEHEINHEVERGDPMVVYALAVLKDGGIIHEVMSVRDINRIRDRSDAWKAFTQKKIKSTPWVTDWDEMARKTTFRRISKYLPSSSDRDAFHAAIERIDDDYTFEIDAAEPEAAQPRSAPTKRRGAGAAALKDITPARPQRQDNDPPHDPDTGEVDRPADEGYEALRRDDDSQQPDDII